MKFFGEEPDVTVNTSKIDMIHVYNWYNYICTNEDSKQFVIEYLQNKNAKKMIRAVEQIDPLKLRHVGWNLRIKYRCGELPQWAEDAALEKLEALVKEQEQKKRKIAEDPARVVVSVQERINTKVSEIIGDFEVEIDKFALTGETTFNPEHYIKSNDIKPLIAKRIAVYYEPLYKEIEAVLKGEDKALKEAYQDWKKPKLKKFLELIGSIIDAGNTIKVKRRMTKKEALAARRKKK